MADTTVRVPVDPAVFIETYPTHCSLTWRVPKLTHALTAVRALEDVTADTTAVSNATNAAGRQQVSLSAVDPGPMTTYVRVEPQTTWTFAWERRTESVAIVTGTLSATTLRTIHRGTGGTGWDQTAMKTADGALNG